MIPQKFIIAVSGGVDSIVLLHMLLARKPDNVTYVIAHFDHGIRSDSSEDAEFVRTIATKSHVTFELGCGELRKDASEEQARNARYTFLREIMQKYKAEKIITAHHQDDLLETMLINIIRGTGPRGLSPMNSPDILRPLLNKRKSEILEYAKLNSLKWREDPTNADGKFLRNAIRKSTLPQIESIRKNLLDINNRIGDIFVDIDARIEILLPSKNVLSRAWFVGLTYAVQKELIRAWLIRCGLTDLDSQTIERISMACKTLQIGKKIDVGGSLWLKSEKQNLLLVAK